MTASCPLTVRPSDRPTTRGAILAGGGATRFGGIAKGLSRVGGDRILDRLVDTLIEAFGEPPLLVANAPEAPSWRTDLRVVRDLRPGFGALGGLYTAVIMAPAPVVCVAWDMPFVPAGLLRELAAGLATADLCLPESHGPRGLEPTCGAYGPATGPAMAAALDAGQLRAVDFHDRVKVGILPSSRVSAWGDPDLLFFNVNTADDLAEADARWRTRESSR